MAASSSISFNEEMPTTQRLSPRYAKQPETVVEQDEFDDDVETGGSKPAKGGYRKKQVFNGWLLVWLAYQSTGVIYGDIGTSPLHVYPSTFSGPPSMDDLLGALSLIIWSLTIIVTINYVFIVLCADDEGEGGTFAIYTLLSRYCNIAERDPRAAMNTLPLERRPTGALDPTGRVVRKFLENSWLANATLKGLSVFGISMIMADGILTPAQSVLGAIQGLKVVDETISTGTIIGVTCAILIGLFMLQPIGIHRLASGFAPIVILWLIFNASFGTYSLVQHDATILKAFSPYYAGLWFVRNKTQGWLNLGGILLAFTGVEALFADLGAFSKRAIQLSWLCLAYPCLLLAYIGSAAFIADDRSAWDNPSFKTVPPGMFYPSLVVSILAAIVASQAIITSVFQLLSQVMTMSYFPHVKMIHSSSTFHGQVYIPMANWVMMVGTVVVTAAYSNTTKLGHAYGFCVICVTFITSCLIALVALVIWQLHPLLPLAVFVPLITFDSLFLSSAATKVPDGAWFTLLLAIILASVFILWRFGKESQWKAEAADLASPNRKAYRDAQGKVHLGFQSADGDLATVRGLGVYFDKGGHGLAEPFVQFVQKIEARPEVSIFLHMRAIRYPTVDVRDRYTVAKISNMGDCYRLVVRHGYNDRVRDEELGRLVYREIRAFLIRNSKAFQPQSEYPADSKGKAPALPKRDESRDHITAVSNSASDFELSTVPAATLDRTIDPEISERVATLDRAANAHTVYIVGKEELRILKPKSGGTWRNAGWWRGCSNQAFRHMILGIFLFIRDNTRAKVSSMQVPVEKLVEVGFVKEM